MNSRRICVVLGAFAVIGMGVVYTRAEQARCAAQALAIESQWIEKRHELWQVQCGTARLRAPGHLHDRMHWLENDLTFPASNGRASARPAFVAGGIQSR